METWRLIFKSILRIEREFLHDQNVAFGSSQGVLLVNVCMMNEHTRMYYGNLTGNSKISEIFSRHQFGVDSFVRGAKKKLYFPPCGTVTVASFFDEVARIIADTPDLHTAKKFTFGQNKNKSPCQCDYCIYKATNPTTANIIQSSTESARSFSTRSSSRLTSLTSADLRLASIEASMSRVASADTQEQEGIAALMLLSSTITVNPDTPNEIEFLDSQVGERDTRSNLEDATSTNADGPFQNSQESSLSLQSNFVPVSNDVNERTEIVKVGVFGSRRPLVNLTPQYVNRMTTAVFESVKGLFHCDQQAIVLDVLSKAFDGFKKPTVTQSSARKGSLSKFSACNTHEERVKTFMETPIIQSLFDTYKQSSGKKQKLHRREILTHFVTQFTLKEVNMYGIKGILQDEENSATNVSPRDWAQAHKDLLQYGPGLYKYDADSEERNIVRYYNEEVIRKAKTIIMSELVKSHSYGSHVVTNSKGWPVWLTSYIKKTTAEASWDHYSNICKNGNEKYAATTEAMSKKNFMSLLDIIAPKGEKMLVALDSVYTKNVLDNSKQLQEIIDVACATKPVLRKAFSERLVKLKSFYSSELKQHLSENSACLHHNFAHLLGKLNNVEQNGAFFCEQFCDECEQKDALIADIHAAIDTMRFRQRPPHCKEEPVLYGDDPCVFDRNSRAGYKSKLDDIDNAYQVYWAHKVRAVQESSLFQSVVDNLKENEAIIIADFKQKMEPIKSREGMVDYFGKSGFPYHGLCFIRKLTTEEKEERRRQAPHNGECDDRDYTVEYWDHAFQYMKEDAEAITGILEAATSQYKREHPHIVRFFLFTDGGPCYKNEILVPFLSYLGRVNNGLHCVAHFISEAGNGKSILGWC